MRFVLVIIAVIVGMALFRHFDFQTLRFEKPGLDSLYAIVFVAALFLLVREARKTGRLNK